MISRHQYTLAFSTKWRIKYSIYYYFVSLPRSFKDIFYFWNLFMISCIYCFVTSWDWSYDKFYLPFKLTCKY